MNEEILAALADVNTTIPGIVESFDGVTVVARPAIPKMLANGEILEPPSIVQVPVRWPIGAGGSAMVTVPLRRGDPVTLTFSQRSIENWLSGSDTAPDDPRQFDLSDAFATPVTRPGTMPADTENVSVQFGPGSMKIAPDGTMTVRTPHLYVEGPSTFNGPIRYTQGMSGVGSGPGNAAIFEGDVIANGVSLIDHRHGGVQSGGSESGPPIPGA